ncbi:uncharacterized protein [Argopecten irradians]|uniref:uncharacterized protein n=1 Tax=Argopecten irradians TaxID=31199 RepID=UPI0037100359
MDVIWNILFFIITSTSFCDGSMCYFKASYYDQFERNRIYKTTHKYCKDDCCRSNNQVMCCTKEDDTDKNGGITEEPEGLMTFGAVFGTLIGIVFGISVCVIVGCYVKRLCFRPIAKLEPKRGKPEHHRAAKYLATLNKKGKENVNKKQPPPRRSRLARRHEEATNFGFDEDEYTAELDYTGNPTTDYFYDDISEGPSPSPILYDNFGGKGGRCIIVSPSCIDFHNLDDDDEAFCERKEPQRSVSIDCGQVDHAVNRRESVVGISVDPNMRHASIC